VRLAHKIWLVDEDGKTFGPGPARLLRGVRQTGSLRKAAAELSMSYNKAWWNIHTMEERLGFSLLHRSTGGAAGGGSTLTPEAVDLLARFDSLQQEAATLLDALFAKHFSGFGVGDGAAPEAAEAANTPCGRAERGTGSDASPDAGSGRPGQ
jgi:molybdate transport system regulatory protein